MIKIKQILKHIMYVLFFGAWIIIMIFPLFSVVLAKQGSIQVGNSLSSNLYLFLVQEEAQNGIGISLTIKKRYTKCLHTFLTYIMWEGQGDSNQYCQCFNESNQILNDSC